jgi:hypothetical protein
LKFVLAYDTALDINSNPLHNTTETTRHWSTLNTMASFEPIVALSTKAKALAQHLLDQQFTKLPEYLQPYVPFLQGLFLGAAASVGIGNSIYRYLQQRNQSKLQLAIFHVLRTLENNPNLGVMLQNPERLALALEAEVMYMIPALLTRSEGDEALKELKRKVRSEQLDLHRHVRPVIDDPRKQRTKVHAYGTDYGFIDRRRPESSSQVVSTATVQTPSTATTMGPFQSAAAPEVNEDENPAYEEYESGEDDQQFTPYTAPTWQKLSIGRLKYEVPTDSSDDEEGEDLPFLPDAELPQTLESYVLTPSAEAARSGYGFKYDDWSDTSSEDDILTPSAEAAKSGFGFKFDDWSGTSCSEHKYTPSEHALFPPVITTREFAPEQKDLALKPKKSLIDRAMESAFDPNSPENRHLPVSHFDKAEACGVRARKGKAIKPRTVLPRTPPTRGFLSVNRDQILRGTSLSPVDEGNSIHRGQSGKTSYRVAETRKFHAEIKAQRTDTVQVRGKQPVKTPERSPGQLEIEALAQEIREDEEALGFTVPTPSISNRFIAAAKVDIPRKSQSSEYDRLRNIGDFFKKSASPVPVETPSTKSDTLQQAQFHDDYEDSSLIPVELIELVKAQQEQQDATPWDSPILKLSPSESEASVTSESHLDDTQSSLSAQSRPVTPEANRSSPDVVCAGPRSPKKIPYASAPSQVLAIAAEQVAACPSSQGLNIKLSPDRTAAMISNPAPPATPTPVKYPRDCSSRIPKGPKSHKISEPAGVSKRDPSYPPKTPVRVPKEKKMDSMRHSSRKTAYKGIFGR